MCCHIRHQATHLIDNFTVFLQYMFFDELPDDHLEQTVSEITDLCFFLNDFSNHQILDKLEFVWLLLSMNFGMHFKAIACVKCCAIVVVIAFPTSSVQFLTFTSFDVSDAYNKNSCFIYQ